MSFPLPKAPGIKVGGRESLGEKNIVALQIQNSVWSPRVEKHITLAFGSPGKDISMSRDGEIEGG